MKNKRDIPNCAICKWKEIRSIFLDRYEYCQAQGFKIISDVYDNKLCRKLYEKKENSNENNQ